MSFTDEEIELINEEHNLRKALLAAKTSDDYEAKREAAQKLREFRQHWRGIRAFFMPQPAEGDGIVAVGTVGAHGVVQDGTDDLGGK